MKKIAISVRGDTESSDGAANLQRAICTLARDLAASGMVGGRREIGGLTISWKVDVETVKAEPVSP